MKKILNLTNHNLTNDQITELQNVWGVTEFIELESDLKALWGQLTPYNYQEVCDVIIELIREQQIDFVHLAGFFPAVTYVNSRVLNCIYAYSVRESVDKVLEDGIIVKNSVFKHKGFFKYL